jgi:HEPN domain-containing protein
MDIEKQVQYWREGSLDDLEAAVFLVEKGKVNQGLFFCHLALEKALKALVWRKTKDTPPFIHDLTRLSQLAAVPLTTEQETFLARASRYNLHGRYEVPLRALASANEARAALQTTKEMVEWLTHL